MYIKKVSALLIIITLLSTIIFIPKTFAISDIIDDAKSFIDSGNGGNNVIDEDKLNDVNSKIYNVLLAFGIAAAVIVGAALGITFIFSSVEGKAKISESLVPYIIGCCVVFGAFTIWKITINIGNNISETDSATTFTYKNGKYYCDNCGDELSNNEQRHAKCGNCYKGIKGI